jgi:hypothetical protein
MRQAHSIGENVSVPAVDSRGTSGAERAVRAHAAPITAASAAAADAIAVAP